MIRKLIAIGSTLVLFLALTGCETETLDPQEQADAQNLLGGMMQMGMMINVDAYSGYTASGPGFFGPPVGWAGPDSIGIPEGSNYMYYEYEFPFGERPTIDSAGIAIDSLRWLAMLTPDIWDSLYQDSLITSIDVWLLGQSRNEIWFHTIVSLPDTLHVSGEMKWNWEDTWFNYEYDVSTVDESGEIDITTSTNIRLSAHFLFEEDGYGSTDDNWGKFQTTTFVKYEFFAEPDDDEYDGYYILLSEAWKIKHYFVLEDNGGA